MTWKEGAIGFAVLGSLAAVAVPVFLRELHASRLVEAIDGTAQLGVGAVAHAEGKRVIEAFPPAAALTPPEVPRGRLAADPVGAWDTPTWRALRFRTAPRDADAPHAFAFAFDSERTEARSTFVARAHGDLDGDGRTSTFEVRGRATATEAARLEPGGYIEAELE